MPSTYWIIGAGGTGSLLAGPLATYLSNYHGNRDETFHLAIIDGDHYEPKNLSRQVFDPAMVDVNKAEALAASTWAEHGRIFAVPEFLTDDNIDRRLSSGDTIFICADNHDVRGRIARWAERVNDCTIINAGNEKNWGTLQLYRRRDGQHVDAPLYWNHPEILTPSEQDPAKLTCQQRAELPGSEQTTAANLMSAAWALTVITAVHAGNPERNEVLWAAGKAESYARSGKGWQDASAA